MNSRLRVKSRLSELYSSVKRRCGYTAAAFVVKVWSESMRCCVSNARMRALLYIPYNIIEKIFARYAVLRRIIKGAPVRVRPFAQLSLSEVSSFFSVLTLPVIKSPEGAGGLSLRSLSSCMRLNMRVSRKNATAPATHIKPQAMPAYTNTNIAAAAHITARIQLMIRKFLNIIKLYPRCGIKSSNGRVYLFILLRNAA